MADPQQAVNQPLSIAPFPAPPPFWKNFSSSNLTRLEALKTEAADNDIPLDPQTLPTELRYLLPPPLPPADAETYTTFQQTHLVNPAASTTLSATSAIPPEDIAALLITPNSSTTSQTNVPAALKSLTNSLLLTFLQLTQLLALDPSHPSRLELMEHLKTLFVNIHVLINSYRPHQAREGVVNMLRDRIDDARGEMRQAGLLKERIEVFLGDLKNVHAPAGQANGDMKAATSREEELDKRMWTIIREINAEEAVALDD